MADSLCILTTGGTIGSALGTTGTTNTTAEGRLAQTIHQLCEDRNVKFRVRKVFNELSENLTPTHWVATYRAVVDEYQAGGRKFVICHGTDTMCYTATALALLPGYDDAVIVFTGSFYTLDHPHSDVVGNLKLAIENATAATTPAGVSIAFNSAATQPMFAHALDVLPMPADATSFPVLYERANHLREKTNQRLRLPAACDVLQDSPSGGSVLPIMVYPGIDLDALLAGTPDATNTVVVLGLYHSGTAPESLARTLRARPDLCVVAGMFPQRLLEAHYDSTQQLMAAGVRVYGDVPWHQLYVYFTLGLMGGLSRDQLLDGLRPWQLLAG